MKKSFYVFVVFIFLFFSSFLSAQEMDTVVLLDTSESMFPYFQSTIDYLIKDIIKNQLKEGDTFHLLSFDSKPGFEISRKLRTSKDVEDILSRVLLLQPLGKYTDLVAALVYVNSYTNDLPSLSKKRIIILTDGIHDPPPGSMYHDSSASAVKQKIKSVTENMKRKGWEVSLIRFPLSTSVSSDAAGNASALEGVDLFPELSKELNTAIIPLTENSNGNELSHKATGDPLIIFPGALGNVKQSFTLPFTVKNYAAKPVQLRLKSIFWNTDNILAKETTLKIDARSSAVLKASIELPDGIENQRYTIPIVLSFSNDMRPYPRTGTITFNVVGTRSPSSFLKGGVFKILLAAVVLFSAFFLLLFIIKRAAETSLRRGKFQGKEKEKITYEQYRTQDRTLDAVEKAKRPLVTTSATVRRKDLAAHSGTAYEMIIDSQNRRIGLRNVQWFTEGSVFTVGGTRSDDFIVFIYPVDRNIAEVTMKNGRIYLTILDKNYFPGVNNKVIDLGHRTLHAVSSDGRSFTLRMEKWVSPLEKINRILHLTDKPGTPDFTY